MLGSVLPPLLGLSFALLRVSALVTLAAFVAASLLGRRSAWALWCLLCALAALRAVDEGAPSSERSASAAVGAFELSSSSQNEDRGRLVTAHLRVEGPSGLIADGELVAVAPARAAPEPARGPVPGPRARSFEPPDPRVALEPDEIVRLAPPPSNLTTFAHDLLRAQRERLLERCRSLPNPETSALLGALLLGDTRAIPRETSQIFLRTGTYHVLAISGLQVALVALLLLAPTMRALAWLVLRSRAARGRLAAVLVGLALLVFVPLVGAGAPVTRSALASTVSLAAPHARARRRVALAPRQGAENGAESDAAHDGPRLPRRFDSLSAWSCALTLECVLRPSAPFSIAVQLSYAATLGLILGTQPVRAGCAQLLGRATRPFVLTLPPRWPWISIPARVAVRAFANAVCASIAAVLATLPFVWATFGEWSPFGILATCVLFLPLAGLLLLGWMRVLLGGGVPDALLDGCSEMTLDVLELFDALPGTPTPLPTRPAELLALVGLGVLCAWAARTPQRRRLGARVAASALGVATLVWTPTPSELELWALDVGSGTACVLHGPGIGTWIFDAGSRDRSDVAREALGPLLATLDPPEVHVVLSHADDDHDGALPWIADHYPIASFAGALPAHVAARLPHATTCLDVTDGSVQLATHASGVAVVLERGRACAGNEGSRSLRITYGTDVILLAGDAEQEGLAAWLARTRPERVRLLLWPHHGSETPELARLLQATDPAEVWISCSGLAPVQAELTRRGVPWRSTAANGVLHMVLTGTP